MDCRVKTIIEFDIEINIFRVSILDLMDCRVKTFGMTTLAFDTISFNP